MGDNDFPTTLGFLNQYLPSVPSTKKPEGYFQQELEGFRDYSQEGTGIRDFKVGQSYKQREGGPVFSQTIEQADGSSMFPMSQEEFRQRVWDQQDRHKPKVPTSPELKQMIKNFRSKYSHLFV
jgi:hypothetical protein